MRYFILYFTFLVTIQAQSISSQLIKNISISSDNITFKQIPLSLDDSLDKYNKLTINKKLLKNKEFYLRVYCDLDKLVHINSEYIIKNYSIYDR